MDNDEEKKEEDQFADNVGKTGPVKITTQINEDEDPSQQETE